MIPGQLCGRSGPNLDPWSLQELREGGIGAVLSVNNGDLVHAEDFPVLGMAYQCTPLSAQAPPRPGDLELCLERLPIAYRFVAEEISKSHVVLVHCRQGKDRTGLFLAYFLMRSLQLAPEDAIQRVKDVRPIAMTAEGWDEFGRNVLFASRE